MSNVILPKKEMQIGGKMVNIVTKLLEGDWKLDISNAFLSKPSRTTRVKILGISKQYDGETLTLKKKGLADRAVFHLSKLTKIDVFAICERPV